MWWHLCPSFLQTRHTTEGFGHRDARKRYVEPHITANAYELRLQRVLLQANISWKQETERRKMLFRVLDRHVDFFKL